MEPTSDEGLRAGAAAASAADAKALPMLRTYRDGLEREAGVISTATRTHKIRLAVLACAAAVAAAYSLLGTVGGEPPILGWVVTALLAVAAAVLARRRAGTERQRTRDLDDLHEKMLSTGRRIDGAERRLRR